MGCEGSATGSRPRRPACVLTPSSTP